MTGHKPLTGRERAARLRAKTMPIFARTERQDVIEALDRLAADAGGSRREALERAILEADAAAKRGRDQSAGAGD